MPLSCSNVSLKPKVYPVVSTPGQITGSTDFNDNSYPTASWNVVPHQRVVGPTIRIGVVAFHVEGIARVRFGCHETTLGNFVAVTSMSMNDSTGCPEYWIDLDLAGGTFDTMQLYGFDCIVEPLHGNPIQLERLFLFVDKNNAFTPVQRYVSVTGSDVTGSGTSIAPYLTIRKAFNSVPAGQLDGAEVILLSSDVGAGTSSVQIAKDHWPILRADPSIGWGTIRWTDWGGLDFAKESSVYTTGPTTSGTLTPIDGWTATLTDTDIPNWVSQGSAQLGRLLQLNSGPHATICYEIVEVNTSSITIRAFRQDHLITALDSAVQWSILGGSSFMRMLKIERLSTSSIQGGQTATTPVTGTLLWVNDCRIYPLGAEYILGDSLSSIVAVHREASGLGWQEDQVFHTNNEISQVDFGLGDRIRLMRGCSIWTVGEHICSSPRYPQLVVGNSIRDVHDDRPQSTNRTNSIIRLAANLYSARYENLTWAWNKIYFSDSDEANTTDNAMFIYAGAQSGHEADLLRGLSIVGNIFENADRANPGATQTDMVGLTQPYQSDIRLKPATTGNHGSWLFSHNTMIRQGISITAGAGTGADGDDLENVAFYNNYLHSVTFSTQPTDASWLFSGNHFVSGSTFSDSLATTGGVETDLFESPLLNDFSPQADTDLDGDYRDTTLGLAISAKVPYGIRGDTDPPGDAIPGQDLGDIVEGIGRSGLVFVAFGEDNASVGAVEINVSTPPMLLSVNMVQGNTTTPLLDLNLSVNMVQGNTTTGVLGIELSVDMVQGSTVAVELNTLEVAMVQGSTVLAQLSIPTLQLSCANSAVAGQAFPAITPPALIPRSAAPPGTPLQFTETTTPIGMWNVVPRQRLVGPSIKIGVIAMDVRGVSRVEFGCHQTNLGSFTAVNSWSINPDTNLPEYWLELNLSSFPIAQTYAFDAIVYPVYGTPLVIDRLYLYIDAADSWPVQRRYVSSSGSDGADGLTPATAKSTVRAAFASGASVLGGRSDGVEVILLTNGIVAGNAGMSRALEHWAILKADPTQPAGSITFNDWTNLDYASTSGTTSLEWLKVEGIRSSSAIQGGVSDSFTAGYLWVNNVKCVGTWQYNQAPSSQDRCFLANRENAVWATNSEFGNKANAFSDVVVLMTGCYIHEIANDCFQGPRNRNILIVGNSIVNCHDGTGDSSNDHSDVWQYESLLQGLIIAWNRGYFTPEHEVGGGLPNVPDGLGYLVSFDNSSPLIRDVALVGNVFENADYGSVSPLTHQSKLELRSPTGGVKQGNYILEHNSQIRSTASMGPEIANGNPVPGSVTPSAIEDVRITRNVWEKGYGLNADAIPGDGSHLYEHNHFGTGGGFGGSPTTGVREPDLFQNPGGNDWTPIQGSVIHGRVAYSPNCPYPMRFVEDPVPVGSTPTLGTVGRSGIAFGQWNTPASIGAKEAGGGIAVVPLAVNMVQGNSVTGALVPDSFFLDMVQGSTVQANLFFGGSTAWYDTAYNQRLEISYNPSFVVGAPKQDFLVLLRLGADNSTVNLGFLEDAFPPLNMVQGSFMDVSGFAVYNSLRVDMVQGSTMDVSGFSNQTSAQVVTPGAGWTGVTTPPNQGNTGPHAIARYNAVPWEEFGSAQGVDPRLLLFTPTVYNVGVVAFHKDGIEKVSFQVDNGPVVDVFSMAYNPQSNAWEYWVQLPASSYASAQATEVRAIAYPTTWQQANGGKPTLVSAGRNVPNGLPLYAGPGAGDLAPPAVQWVDPVNGNDLNSGTSQGAAKRSYGEAVNALGPSGRNGGYVYLLPGNHVLGTNPQSFNNLTRWVNILPAPDQTEYPVIPQTATPTGNKRVRYIHCQAEEHTFPENTSVGPSQDWLCLRDCLQQGDETPNGVLEAPYDTAPVSVSYSTSGVLTPEGFGLVPGTQWTDFFVLDTTCRAFPQGIIGAGAGFCRNVTLEVCSRRYFENVAVSIQCRGRDYVPLPDNPAPLAGNFNGDGWALSNINFDGFLVYCCDMRAPTQLIFVEDLPAVTYRNLAVVNSLLAWKNGGELISEIEVGDHIVFWNSAYLAPGAPPSGSFAASFFWQPTTSQVSIKNSIFHRSGGALNSVVDNCHYINGTGLPQGTQLTFGSSYEALFVNAPSGGSAFAALEANDFRPLLGTLLDGAARPFTVIPATPADLNGFAWGANPCLGPLKAI